MKTTHSNAPIAVIGAGPAGLMAALAAAEGGRRVVVFERMPEPGLKLLATGGGRCNLTNLLPPEKFMAAFGRHGRFMAPALQALDAGALRVRLESLGAPSIAPDGLHVYPKSESARAVRQALLVELQRRNGVVECGREVRRLQISVAGIVGVELDGKTQAASAVILAAGGCGYPGLGGTPAGFALAEQAGHAIMPTVPALTPLRTAESWIPALAGVSVPAVTLSLRRGRQSQAVSGALLFTHRGISGPAVLDLSGAVAHALQESAPVSVVADWLPGLRSGDEIKTQRAENPAGTVRGWLRKQLPDSLACQLLTCAGLDKETRFAGLSGAAQDALARTLSSQPISIAGTEGFEQAMVTRGGIALNDVDPKTLASRRMAGLFFAGEVLDLDGPSGGFNLQWAFSSGYLAGQSAARETA